MRSDDSRRLSSAFAGAPNYGLITRRRCIWRALVLKELNRFEEALADNVRAIELDPANADSCNNMGTILGELGRIGEALSWYNRSLKIRPDVARTVTNRAGALAQLSRFDEAMAGYRRAVAIDPDRVEAAWNLALLQLLTGDFEAGWRGRGALEKSGAGEGVSETVWTDVARKTGCRREDGRRLLR